MLEVDGSALVQQRVHQSEARGLRFGSGRQSAGHAEPRHAALIVGVSVNPGASAVWTHKVITAELLNV